MAADPADFTGDTGDATPPPRERVEAARAASSPPPAVPARPTPSRSPAPPLGERLPPPVVRRAEPEERPPAPPSPDRDVEAGAYKVLTGDEVGPPRPRRTPAPPVVTRAITPPVPPPSVGGLGSRGVPPGVMPPAHLDRPQPVIVVGPKPLPVTLVGVAGGTPTGPNTGGPKPAAAEHHGLLADDKTPGITGFLTALLAGGSLRHAVGGAVLARKAAGLSPVPLPSRRAVGRAARRGAARVGAVVGGGLKRVGIGRGAAAGARTGMALARGAGAALGAVGGPLAGVAGPVGLIAAAVGTAVKGAVDHFTARGRELAPLSGELAGATARADVTSLMADIREANSGAGKEMARMIDNQSRLEVTFRELLLPLKEQLLKVVNWVLETFADLVDQILKLGEGALDVLNDILDTLPGGDRSERIDGMIADIRRIREHLAGGGGGGDVLKKWLDAGAAGAAGLPGFGGGPVGGGVAPLIVGGGA